MIIYALINCDLYNIREFELEDIKIYLMIMDEDECRFINIYDHLQKNNRKEHLEDYQNYRCNHY